jgi:hypothetical protein
MSEIMLGLRARLQIILAAGLAKDPLGHAEQVAEIAGDTRRSSRRASLPRWISFEVAARHGDFAGPADSAYCIHDTARI